jgi:hypothetical protein
MKLREWLNQPAPIVLVGLLWPIAGFTVGTGVGALLSGNIVVGFFAGTLLGFAGLAVGIIKAAPDDGDPPDLHP